LVKTKLPHYQDPIKILFVVFRIRPWFRPRGTYITIFANFSGCTARAQFNMAKGQNGPVLSLQKPNVDVPWNEVTCAAKLVVIGRADWTAKLRDFLAPFGDWQRQDELTT